MSVTTKRAWERIVGLLFIAAGANHFIAPKPYLSMMPSFLPAHVLLVQVSGVAEILGGMGVFLQSTRHWAAWGLILLLVAVFPANFNVAVRGWPGVSIPDWALWCRLPLQPLLIWWVYSLYIKDAHKVCDFRGSTTAPRPLVMDPPPKIQG
jgi:uncharacterized membrane protein